MWKAWKIKISILDNAIASNFISVDGRDEILTKDSAVYWSSLLPAKVESFFPIKSSQWGFKNFRLIQNVKQCRQTLENYEILLSFCDSIPLLQFI